MTASSAAQPALAAMARAGVAKRGCTCARDRKNTPSRAMAKYMRGPVSASPFAALKIDTRMASVTSVAADGPNSARTASAATRSEAATPEAPRAATYPTLAVR